MDKTNPADTSPDTRESRAAYVASALLAREMQEQMHQPPMSSEGVVIRAPDRWLPPLGIVVTATNPIQDRHLGYEVPDGDYGLVVSVLDKQGANVIVLWLRYGFTTAVFSGEVSVVVDPSVARSMQSAIVRMVGVVPSHGIHKVYERRARRDMWVEVLTPRTEKFSKELVDFADLQLKGAGFDGNMTVAERAALLSYRNYDELEQHIAKFPHVSQPEKVRAIKIGRR